MARPALIVEDDTVSATLLGEWLREAGFQPERVVRGDEAIAAAAQLRPEVVLIDLVLPGPIDGAALAAHLMLKAEMDAPGVVVVSARSDAVPTALIDGGARFLAKPFTREELLAAVEGSIAQAQATPTVVTETAGVLRVPDAASMASTPPPEAGAEGVVGPDPFIEILRRLLEQDFSGILDAESGGPPVRIALRRGHPVYVRCVDASSTFGRVLVDLGFLADSDLAVHLAAGRRAGLPLGEVLLRARLIDRQAVELTLREQVLRRVLNLCRAPPALWRATPSTALGLAGFDVHLAAVTWRLGDTTPEVPIEPAGFLHLPAWIRSWWRLFDPEDAHGDVVAQAFSGAPAAEVLAAGGPTIERLVRHLAGYQLVEFKPTPPHTPEGTRPGPAFLAAFSDGIVARQRLWADASHYTVLGLGEDADAESIDASTVAALAAWHPGTLPAGLDAPTRTRARELYLRILEAGRVLGEPARRAVYDGRHRGEHTASARGLPTDEAPILLAERAILLLRGGDAVVAAGLLDRAVVRGGEDPSILLLRGEARLRACPEDPTAGEADLRRAVELDPESDTALVALGDRFRSRGADADARRCYRDALRRNFACESARVHLLALEAAG